MDLKRSANVRAKILVQSTPHVIALGKLTLAYAAVEETITELLAVYFSAISRSLDEKGFELEWAEEKLARHTLPVRVKTVKRMADTISRETGVSADELKRHLDRVLNLSLHRHDLMHGWVRWDAKRNRPVFRNRAKKRIRSADPSEIEKLTDELTAWLFEFSKILSKFYESANAYAQPENRSRHDQSK